MNKAPQKQVIKTLMIAAYKNNHTFLVLQQQQRPQSQDFAVDYRSSADYIGLDTYSSLCSILSQITLSVTSLINMSFLPLLPQC